MSYKAAYTYICTNVCILDRLQYAPLVKSTGRQQYVQFAYSVCMDVCIHVNDHKIFESIRVSRQRGSKVKNMPHMLGTLNAHTHTHTYKGKAMCIWL